MSNTNSNFVKTKKKKYRDKCVDGYKFGQGKVVRSGVYVWGKGLSSGPMLYPFAKNLDVCKIACGNYHVVIATTVGIFGWG